MDFATHRTRPLRGAIIGFGKMAEKGHLPGWRRFKEVSIAAVCDPSVERRSLAETLLPGARTYARWEDLYEKESLDFVDICTPPPFHAAAILAALEQGLNVLCEKPLVSTRTEFRKVCDLAQRKNRILYPVHNWKHAPVLERALQWIGEGLLGQVLYSQFHTLRTRPASGLTDWRGQKREAGGGGILLDHGWHGIYVLLGFHGERPLEVSAWMDPRLGTGRAEHTTHLELYFPRGAASLFLTWSAPKRHNSARIYGEKGLITIEDDRIGLQTADGRIARARFSSPLSEGSHHPDWTARLLVEFLDALGDPSLARRALEEAFLCLEISLLAYASGQSRGRRMKIPTPGRSG